jgi:hypothetical protein
METMRRSREEILEWEARWRTSTALATIGGVLLLVLSIVVVADISGDGSAEILEKAHEHSSSVVLSGVLQGVGFLLLGAALIYLFRAASARSEKVRPQLIGLFVAVPVFLALSAGINAISTGDAADKFAAGNAKGDLTRAEAKEECSEDREDKGGAEFAKEYDAGGDPLADCTNTKLRDDAAEDVISGAAIGQIASGLQLAGRLGLAFALLYGCLYAMRVGLLTRFWGSLGMALGVAALLPLIQFTLIWFLYFGFLLLGWVPGGRPPAWAAGEAIPWPSPGEKVAAELEPEEPDDAGSPPELGTGDDEPGPGGERRKRKQRD